MFIEVDMSPANRSRARERKQYREITHDVIGVH